MERRLVQNCTQHDGAHLDGQAVVIIKRNPLISEHSERHLLFLNPEHVRPLPDNIAHLTLTSNIHDTRHDPETGATNRRHFLAPVFGAFFRTMMYVWDENFWRQIISVAESDYTTSLPRRPLLL